MRNARIREATMFAEHPRPAADREPELDSGAVVAGDGRARGEVIEYPALRERVEQDTAQHFGVLALDFGDFVGHGFRKPNSQIDGTLLPHRFRLTQR